jgi:hypothetical protein
MCFVQCCCTGLEDSTLLVVLNARMICNLSQSFLITCSGPEAVGHGCSVSDLRSVISSAHPHKAGGAAVKPGTVSTSLRRANCAW